MEVATCTLFCFCFINTWQITFQNLQTRNSHGLPTLKDYKGSENDERIGLHHQAIIPTYKFSCCGNVTEWGLDVFEDQISFTLDLQVWRPSPTVDDSTGTGCYSLMGNNRFTSITLSSGLALMTPSPQDYIQFQPGDVLGFYVEDARRSRYPPGVVLQLSPSYYTSELVWFASVSHEAAASQNGDCPYSIGRSGVLTSSTKAAPVISISITSVPCSPSPAISTQTDVKSILPSMHTPSNNIISSSKTTTVVESTLSIHNNISSRYDVSSGIPNISKSTTTETNKPIVKTPLFENKIALIISVVVPTFVSLIIIVTLVIVILLRRRKKSCKGKQREPGECVSQQGISNQTYFESESQLQNNEAGIEIVPADNGEAVIYHCIGPSTSSGKTVSDSEQPETHHYFELEALPTHQYADIGQLSTGQDKDQTVAKLGKSVPVYEDICSQKFQDSKECESELKDVSTETGGHTQTSENSQYAKAK